MLPPNFEEPVGFQWGNFTNAKGANIRYGSLQPVGVPKGTVVLVAGFGEPIEKYFEVMRELTDKGFAVWMMDWRGQGGSDRFLSENPQKMYSEGYSEHVETLYQFADKIVQKSPGPMILTAHSMGAHIGLRCLKEHEGTFDSAIVSAPMLNINTGSLARPVARQVAKFAKAGNYLEKYVPGGKDWDEKDPVFAASTTTSDPDRFRVITELYTAKPELRTGSPTYGWIYHTFESIDILNKEEYLKAINVPILMEISGNEVIVDKEAEERASKLLPHCTRVDIPDAKHEIWMERDALRNQWLVQVDAFLKEQLNNWTPSPKKPDVNSLPPPSKPAPPKMG